ncbi:c-type cytochrome [Xenophilus sp. Marseille-Q4582]|uniref:c-type cytochrome n=1 Tax=Xenophilus sp. Marseille-Q4582 TaxID=2866600 RepID=UPI001CE3B9D0|nr:c-type cytochrome [Xenophilus sp. Marseille-Q4582]
MHCSRLPRFWPALSLAAAAAFAAPAQADLALARAKNCMSCHTAERKVIGPSFKDIAARYRSQEGAESLLAAKILKGGSGVWGPVPMPANTQVSEAEARKLAAWVLRAH